MGLVALVRLASKRVDKKTRGYYNSIEKAWSKVRKALTRINTEIIKDFSVVQNAEPTMRERFLKIVWYSTKRFGNKEFKRVYSWLEGSVGPLNALLNYAGARLRDLAATGYPFPKPESFQVRVYANGRKKILSKKEADDLGKDNAVETYWRAGYRRKGKRGILLLAHPTLPEMDFVDMIRAHIVELCRQCFIHNVPRSDAHRYIRLLIHNLRPFLDWVYTEGDQGRPYFNRYSDIELRKIVVEIRSLYGKRSGREKPVTKTLDDDLPTPNVDLVRSKLIALKYNTNDKDEKKFYGTLLDLIDEGMVADRDIEKLVEQVHALSSREGNEWHRILLSDLHHPKSLKQVVFQGDTFLESLSSVLVVGELPVAKGKGRIDLVIFIRRKFENTIFWTPIMILEIKTKTSFDFNLYGVRTSNKNKKDYVPSFYAWKRAASEEEWNKIFTSNPQERTLNQLDAYETELLDEYRNLVAFDTSTPNSLWKGVIVLDTDQKPLELFNAFQNLLNDLVMGVLNNILDPSKQASYCLDLKNTGLSPRIAVVITPNEGPAELLKEAQTPKSLRIDDPFKERKPGEKKPDARILTNYVCVSSPVSYGNAAEWIAKNWHLLNHIQECMNHSEKPLKIHWLDLVGDFSEKALTKKRFGLEELLKNGAITEEMFTGLDNLLDDVNFINLGPNVDSIIAGDKKGIEDSIGILQSLSGDSSESIIVVDGWIEFKNMVPSKRYHLIEDLENKLLDSLPSSKTNIIWVDNGVEHTRMNKHYQRSCISPLPHDSPRSFHMDEIIYNAPTATRSFGRILPRRDDERFIIQDTDTTADPWSSKIHVPHLVGFSIKFRGLIKRKPTTPRGWGDKVKVKEMYGRQVTLSSIQTDKEDRKDKTKALSLIPSLSRPRDPEKAFSPAVPKIETKELIPHTIVLGSASTRSSRMTIRPEHPIPEPNKAEKEYVPASEITRDWRYDLFPSRVYGEDDEEYMVRRPPTIRTTNKRDLDTYVIRERELRRLLNTVRFLKKKVVVSEELHDCYDEVEEKCLEIFSSGNNGPDDLLEALIHIARIIFQETHRARFWESIRPIRNGLFEIANSDNRSALEKVMEENPDVLLLYGNNLLLVLFAVMEKVYGEISTSHALYLWESVVEWELYQLGFKAQQSSVVSKYDIHAIFSNLMLRARNLHKLGLPKHTLAKQNAGQIVRIQEIESAWVIFQINDQMIAGLIEDYPGELYPKWHYCVNDPEILENAGKLALQSDCRKPVFITKVGMHKVLWMFVERDAGPELSPFVLEYKTPRKRQLTVPWIKLSDPWKVPTLDRGSLIEPVQDDDDDSQGLVDAYLKKIVTFQEKEVVKVTCEIGVDVGNKMYQLDFKDIDDDSIVETLTFKETDKVVRVLRHVITTGKPFRTPSEKLLLWEYTTDVKYDWSDDTAKKITEKVSVSFLKLLIRRKSFLPDYFTYPMTCEELLNATNGPDIKLIVSRSRKRFKVELEGLASTSGLKKIERLELGIYDVGLFVECEQLIDVENQTRHKISVYVDDALAEKSVPDMSEFPRFHKVLDALIESKNQEYDYDPEIVEDGQITEEMYIEYSEIEVFVDEEEIEPLSKEDTIEVHGIQDDESIVKLDQVTTGEDSVGGKVIFVVLKIGNKTPNIPVTDHFHSIREIGRIPKDEFVSSVESKLSDYDLREEDLEQAVKECVRIMKQEKLIKR